MPYPDAEALCTMLPSPRGPQKNPLLCLLPYPDAEALCTCCPPVRPRNQPPRHVLLQDSVFSLLAHSIRFPAHAAARGLGKGRLCPDTCLAAARS